MKAVINPQLLGKELRKASAIIKKNTVIPILSSAKLIFTKNKLTTCVTDLETTFVSWIDCECQKPFNAIVEFSKLSDICSKIFEPVSFEVSENNIIISSSGSKIKLSNQNDAETFPSIPEDVFLFDFSVESDFFIALSNANLCKSSDTFKPNMNTACIDIKKDTISIVGIDGFVSYKKDLKIDTGKEMQLLVAEQFVQSVKSFEEAKISAGEKFIKVESGNITIISRLFDSKFCPYQSIIPKDISFNLKSNRSALIKALGIAGVAASAATHLCTINFNGGDIKINAQDIDLGNEAENVVPVTHQVEIKSIGLNGGQLLKLINIFDSEDVEMSFRGESQTIFLRPSKDPSTICLLQPVAL